jgi:hypothetical protein
VLAARPAPPPTPLSEPHEEIVTDVAGREAPDGPPVVYRVRSMCGPHARWQLEAGAVITGVPLAVVGLWLAQGRFKAQAGVFAPEQIVPPEPFFTAIAQRGISTRLVKTEDLS